MFSIKILRLFLGDYSVTFANTCKLNIVNIYSKYLVIKSNNFNFSHHSCMLRVQSNFIFVVTLAGRVQESCITMQDCVSSPKKIFIVGIDYKIYIYVSHSRLLAYVVTV